MPILGRSGESISQRLFGRPGLQNAGAAIVHGNLGAIAKRIKQGMDNPGGFLGKTAQAAGPEMHLQDGVTIGKNPDSSTPGLKYGPEKPADLNAAPKGNGSGTGKNSEVSKIIGAGWDDTSDVISATGKALQTSKNYISNLGKVKDQYLRANDKYKADVDTAIEGNKTLIEENQREELDDLASDTRKSVDNTNVMLGIKGASGGSAAKAASRAISEMAGKNRAKTLTMRGNEMSEQTQEQENAKAEYELRRQKAYDWEKSAREQAIIEWASDSDALSRLKKNTGKWKDQDVKAESDRNLSKLLNNLAEISGRAKVFRENLAAKMAEFGGSADELESAAINVDAPAELMTPDFNENIDLNNPETGEDFFDPKKVGKRVIKGYDSLGNPIYEDEFNAAVAAA